MKSIVRAFLISLAMVGLMFPGDRLLASPAVVPPPPPMVPGTYCQWELIQLWPPIVTYACYTVN
jgi:hypothetical protein